MKFQPLGEKVANGPGVYQLVCLRSPDGEEVFAECHGTSYRHGASSHEFVEARAGGRLQIAGDSGWSWSPVDRATFKRETGLEQPKEKYDSMSDPWWLERQRNPVVRAILRSAEEMKVPLDDDLREAFFPRDLQQKREWPATSNYARFASFALRRADGRGLIRELYSAVYYEFETEWQCVHKWPSDEGRIGSGRHRWMPYRLKAEWRAALARTPIVAWLKALPAYIEAETTPVELPTRQLGLLSA